MKRQTKQHGFTLINPKDRTIDSYRDSMDHYLIGNMKGHSSPNDYESSDKMMREQRNSAFTLIGPKDNDQLDRTGRERAYKTAFTLIELIVVMAIIGILVLLAAPKFLGYTQKATDTKDIHTVKVIETALEAYLINGGTFPDGLEMVDKNSLETSIENKNVIDVNGYVTNLDDSTYYELTYSFIRDSLNVKLSVNSYSNLFLIAEASSAGLNAVYASNQGVIFIDKGKALSGYTTSNNETPPDYDEYLASDTDFEWVTLNTEGAYFIEGEIIRGFYKYIGTEKIVKIPDTINGHELTSFYRMFHGTTVEKVISYNSNITSMNSMFINSYSLELDVSALYTSSVTDMGNMFRHSKATKIIFTNFDTSNVTNMNAMFWGSSADKLDLSMFETTNVTVMTSIFQETKAIEVNINSFNVPNVEFINHMFNAAQITSIDLSSFDLRNFDTTNPNSIYMMFANCNIKTVYVRSQAEINIFNNAYTQKPSGLVFIIK